MKIASKQAASPPIEYTLDAILLSCVFRTIVYEYCVEAGSLSSNKAYALYDSTSNRAYIMWQMELC